VHKKDVGPPADIYAMGLIMAEMLVGEKLIQIESVYDTIMYQASDKPIKLPGPVADSPFADIIERAVEKDTDNRYATATDMYLDLEALDLGDRQSAPVEKGLPTEFGEADEDEMTSPASSGMPSIHEVDSALAEKSNRGSIDPFADYPDYEDDATTNKQSGFEVAPVEASSSRGLSSGSSGEYQPDSSGSQRAASGVGEHDATVEFSRDARDQAMAAMSGQGIREETAPMDAFESEPDLDLDRERPDRARPTSNSGPNIVLEILLGIVIGGIVLGLAMFFFMN
jgi:serine/threonine protein kinase